jgi:rubrerythrin
MPEVNKLWREIIKDEEKHYKMFLELIHSYDLTECQLHLKHASDSYIKTPMQEYKPKYHKQLILNNIREDIKGENEAIILYEQIENELPYQDIIDVFDFVITDEKEHVEELTALLAIYDSENK